MSTKKKRIDQPPFPPPPAPPPPAPPPPPPPPPLPPDTPSEPEPYKPQPVAPVVQMAIDEVTKARARAAVAAATAAEPVTLPSTPAFNTIGEQLRETFHPVSPAAELLVLVRLDIDGSKLSPSVEHTYTETVLWNAHESAATADAFAKHTCVEVGLPAVFEEAIAAQLKKAGKEAITAEDAAAESGGGVGGVGGVGSVGGVGGVGGVSGGGPSSAGGGVLALELHVELESGVELRDHVIWDTSRTEPTPEQFARQLCADLGVPDLEGAVAIAVREQLLAARLTGASAQPVIEPGAPVVRSEAEALEWTPIVTVDGGVDADDWLAEAKEEAERRDQLRRRHSGGGPGEE